MTKRGALKELWAIYNVRRTWEDEDALEAVARHVLSDPLRWAALLGMEPEASRLTPAAAPLPAITDIALVPPAVWEELQAKMDQAQQRLEARIAALADTAPVTPLPDCVVCGQPLTSGDDLRTAVGYVHAGCWTKRRVPEADAYEAQDTDPWLHRTAADEDARFGGIG